MPGAEDDGNGVALLVFQRGEEVRDAFQPFVEERMTHAARYDGLHRMLRVGHACRHVVLVDTPESVRCGVIRLDVVLYPCRGAEHGVARMPRDGDDAAPCMMVDDGLPDACEGHGIEVLQVALLYTAEVEAHHGGVVAHQLVCVRASLVPVPCDAVERVVLMTVHIPALLYLRQTFNQLLACRLLCGVRDKGERQKGCQEKHRCCDSFHNILNG